MRIAARSGVLVVVLALLLSACGGGGGGGAAPMTPPAPVLTALSPSSASAGTLGVTLTVSGANFTAQSVVKAAASPKTTTFVSASQLTAQLSAGDLATPRPLSISVAQPDAPASNTLTFTVTPPKPAAVTAHSPTQVDAGGGDFMLTLLGQDFIAGSVARWNGSARPTSFVSATEVIARIPAADIAGVGSGSVAVDNGAGSLSNEVTVQVNAPSKDAVSLQINTAHNGAVAFDSISFPAASTWSTDVGGPPSVALIAGGKVFVIAPGTPPTTNVLALDAATGAIVWTKGVTSRAGIAYDQGTLIVMFQSPANSALVQILDATTGSATTPQLELVSNDQFLSAPVARDGLIFIGGAGNFGGGDSPVLYAVSEQTGAIMWQQPLGPALTVSTPVVTVDGVYLSYASQVYAFRPLTGESLWSGTSAVPPAGGGATGVVANGRFFAPDVANTYNGHIYDAATGALQGTYSADGPAAIGTQVGYFLSGGTLSALTLADFTSLWTFTGDGHLVTSPLLVGNYVIVGSDTGNLYALDATTGAQVWQVSVGSPLPKALGYDAVMPYSAMSAGDGLLVVPAGNSVVAYTLSTSP